MTTDELKDILQRGEGRRVEFKLAWDGVPVSLFPSVAAMLNREGGVIVLGVDDQGTIIGINPSCLEQMKKDIVTSLNNPEIIQPPVNLPVYQMVSDGATLLCLKVPVSSQVHFCKGVIYDRENDSDLAICDDTRISDLYFGKRQTFSESEMLKHLRFDDFDKRLFDKTRAIVSAADHTHPWVEADDMTILRTSQLYRRDLRRKFFAEFGWTDEPGFIFDFAGLDMKKVPQGITEGIKQLPLDIRFSNIEDPNVFLFQKGSSWAEKGGKLLSKRTLHILRILILCVELLIIDKPNSPDQKYRLTRKGKLFLGGFELLNT